MGPDPQHGQAAMVVLAQPAVGPEQAGDQRWCFPGAHLGTVKIINR